MKMDKELTEIEEQLSSLTLGKLDDSLLSSLESAMLNCTSSEDLKEIEGQLACLTPRELSEDQLDHLESAVMGSKLEGELQEFTPAALDTQLFANLENMMESASQTPSIVPFEAPRIRFLVPQWPHPRESEPVLLWSGRHHNRC